MIFFLYVSLVRLVSLAPNLTEMVLWLGTPQALVGVTIHDTFQAVQDLPRVGGFATPNWEKVMDLKPDWVLITHTQAPLFEEDLYRLDLSPLVLSTATLEDIFQSLDTLASLLGQTHRSQYIQQWFQNQFSSFSQPSESIRVLVVVGRARGSLEGLYVAGAHTFYEGLVKRVGWQNVVIQKGYIPMTPEQILRLHPSQILDITGDSTSGVYTILHPAQVFFLPPDPFQRPGLCALWVFLKGWKTRQWKSAPCPPSVAISR